MITFTFGTVAFANAYVNLAAAFARCFSSYTLALNPVTLVNERTGILNASQYSTNSAAFAAPSADNDPSNSATTSATAL